MPNNAKKSVYKEKEFNIYVLWKFLPVHFKGMKRSELVALGFTDPVILRIIKIKNQTEFAKYFHIKDLGTLTDWNNKIQKDKITSPLLTVDFQKQLSTLAGQIILPNIDELKREISAKDRMISSLKKENSLLKKGLRPFTPKQRKRSVSPSLPTTLEVTSLTKLQTNISKDRADKTVFQKLKEFFK